LNTDNNYENLIHIFKTGWTGSGRLREKS